MRSKLTHVRANSIRPLLAATLAFAITFTLSCSSGSGDNNDGGSGGSNISDLPTQAYLPDGSKFAGSSEITLRIPFYVGRSSSGCSSDGICPPDECTDYNGNEHECTEYEYRNTYDSKTAGKIENGQISLSLPNIDSKYLLPWKTRCDDEKYEYECTVSFPKNLAWFPVENLYTTITGKSCRIALVGGAYEGMGFLSYFSESGNITGTKCYNVRNGVCDDSNNYDLAISNGWGAYYYYKNNRHSYYTSDLSKTGTKLEWQIVCD
jgi:hypothetical protein